MTAFIALLHRDLRVVRRDLQYFLLRVALQPLLFTFIFGYVMPRMGIIQRGYTEMLLPGILGLSMTLSSMQAVALPLVIDFGWSKEIEDRLLRSEEHTSELQSQSNLVCSLLLEKKKASRVLDFFTAID